MNNTTIRNDVFYKGLSEQVLKSHSKFPDDSIDLVVTSPPYSDRRKDSYGGIAPDKYVDWFLPISSELYRMLKPSGSLVINIKEHVKNGERQTYVIEMILAMKKQGWRWVEEYCWYKKTSFPGKWKNRFRDSFERCLHFTKEKDFFMDQESVKVPIGDWASKRFKSMSDNDFLNRASNNNPHLRRKVANWLDKETVNPHNVLVFENEQFCITPKDNSGIHNPSNVIELSPITSNKNHSACFPIELPTWFIKLLSPIEGIVLDPFSGVGTTAVASCLLNRHYIGVEKEQDYIDLSRKKLKSLNKALQQNDN